MLVAAWHVCLCFLARDEFMCVLKEAWLRCSRIYCQNMTEVECRMFSRVRNHLRVFLFGERYRSVSAEEAAPLQLSHVPTGAHDGQTGRWLQRKNISVLVWRLQKRKWVTERPVCIEGTDWDSSTFFVLCLSTHGTKTFPLLSRSLTKSQNKH